MSFKKGVAHSAEHRQRIAESKRGIPRNEEARKNIRIASAKNFKNQAFLDKRRKSMEEGGHWVPLDQKSSFDLYYKKSNWPERMYDYIEDESQLQLLRELGIFNSRKNSKGVVRDHIYSRRTGFENGVPPEIMRHPCNCQILTHSQNVSKKRTRYRDRDDQSLPELCDKIKSFQRAWSEQEECLRLIDEVLYSRSPLLS